MNKLVFKLFCLVAIAICGCAQDGTGMGTGFAIESHFCPKEDCSKVMEMLIRNATASINCAFYDINLENLIDALSDQSLEADVRAIIESDTLKGQIKGPGIKKDRNSALMHNKFCIIDNSIVTTGSMNPTHNDNEKNSNNLVIIRSRAAAEIFNQEFFEMWNGKFGGGERTAGNKLKSAGSYIEIYFCPEDKCAEALVRELNSAEKSIYFMTFSFTSESISDAVISGHLKGIEAKGILDSSQAAGQYSSFDKLKEAGIDIVREKGKYKLHHKVFIIDNLTVVTGSFNPTLNGDTRNDENMLIIKDRNTTLEFLEEFEDLWKENIDAS
jgi:phosphatidylserine/phosphatidylglycerophosphate/cardiolipin synthase-like enzyme